MKPQTFQWLFGKIQNNPEVAKAFLESLYNEEDYVKFLDSTPVGMLPTIKGISDSAAYKENETRKKFKHAEEVITEAIKQYPKGRFIFFNINCKKCEWGLYQARN